MLLFTLHLASTGVLKFEAGEKGKIQERAVIEVAAIIEGKIEGKIMNLSVEAKVAIAVATSFVVLMMGAIASQG